VFGCDSSGAMIGQACKKNDLRKIPFFINDIRNIALPNKCVDVAVLLYDSLNYLLDEEALMTAIAEIYRILAGSGLFIFDIVSEKHCLHYYADYQENEYWGQAGYSRHSYFNQDLSRQYNDFRIVLNGFTYKERHVQQIYATDYLVDILQANSLFKEEYVSGL